MRLFRIVVAIAALVPILAGGAGMVQGPAMLHGATPASADLDSHFRYLSGLLAGIGLAFVYAAWSIGRRAGLFRALALIVILGGAARLFGALTGGLPGGAHRFAFVMELIVTPLLLLWAGRVEREARTR